MLPRPMKPISMTCPQRVGSGSPASARDDESYDLLFRLLGEHLARLAEGINPGGYTRVDRDLHEDFADLILCQPIGKGAADVQFQFMRAVEDRDHREIEHRALLARQTRTAPSGAPAIFGDEFLERLVEVV